MAIDKSIAVLPFENMSTDPENEYFSDGISEEIINALSRIAGLQVTARTSSFAFKNQKKDVRTIGRALGVALVLEGSVRKAGARVRITAQLIRTDNGFHIWSENFDRQLTNIFELQDEISLLIAGKIREDFGHFEIQDQLVDAPTANIKAYQLYLKGRYYHNRWNLPAFAEAAKFYQKSIDEDPSFAAPYFGAGLSYSFLGSWGRIGRKTAFQYADDYFRQGLLLSTPTQYTYYCVAKHLFWGKWKYEQAYGLLLEAWKLSPQHSDINEFIAEINTALGDFTTAERHIDRSLKVNPLSPNHYYTKGNIFYLQGRFEAALAVLDKGLDLEPDFAVIIELKLACLIQLGLYNELKKILSEQGSLSVPETYELMYRLLWQSGEVDQTEIPKIIEQLQKTKPNSLFAWDLFLLIHAGDTTAAIRLLEQKTANNVGQIINFKHDPFLEPLQDAEDYQQLVQRYFPATALEVVTKERPISKELLSAEQVKRYSQLLLSKMKEEKYYLAADLNLRDLANTLEIHPNKLSWLLNKRLAQNFSDFVNSFRLKEFQRIALDPHYHHLNILGLALESGFSSKSVFNEYFRKTTGLTPKSWVKQQRNH